MADVETVPFGNIGALIVTLLGCVATLIGASRFLFRRYDHRQEQKLKEQLRQERADKDRRDEEVRTALTMEQMYIGSVREMLDRQKAEIEMLKDQDEERRMQIAQLQERCTQLDITYQRRCSLLEIECRRLRLLLKAHNIEAGPEPEFS